MRPVSINRILLAGDFKYGDILWREHHVNGESQRFIDILNGSYLCQHIMDSSRDESTLDLVISSFPDDVDDIQILDPLSSSDHNAIGLKFKFLCPPCQSESNRTFFEYGLADYIAIDNDLATRNWDELKNACCEQRVV